MLDFHSNRIILRTQRTQERVQNWSYTAQEGIIIITTISFFIIIIITITICIAYFVPSSLRVGSGCWVTWTSMKIYPHIHVMLGVSCCRVRRTIMKTSPYIHEHDERWGKLNANNTNFPKMIIKMPMQSDYHELSISSLLRTLVRDEVFLRFNEDFPENVSYLHWPHTFIAISKSIFANVASDLSWIKRYFTELYNAITPRPDCTR